MDERTWLTSTDPADMLAFFTTSTRRVTYANPTIEAGTPLISPRKLRLFACACARHVWDGVPCSYCVGGTNPGGPDYASRVSCLHCDGTGRVGGLTDPRSRRAVETAEKFADAYDDADAARQLRAAHRYLDLEAVHTPAWVLAYAACQLPETTHPPDISRARNAVVPPAVQAALLRCLCGNPWRPVTLSAYEPTPSYVERGVLGARRVSPAAAGRVVEHPWLAWDGGTIPAMARAVYVGRDWELLPQLADALESAGCPVDVACTRCEGGRVPALMDGKKIGSDYDQVLVWTARICPDCHGTGRVPHPLLQHCRDGGPHARGCHVLDLILGLL